MSDDLEPDTPLTPQQLRLVALELRQYAGRHAATETEVTKFLDRADELRAQARAIEGSQSLKFLSNL